VIYHSFSAHNYSQEPSLQPAHHINWVYSVPALPNIHMISHKFPHWYYLLSLS